MVFLYPCWGQFVELFCPVWGSLWNTFSHVGVGDCGILVPMLGGGGQLFNE